MYISLGLLWFVFKITRGEVIKCPIGGLTNDHNCEKLNLESLLYKFYITSFEEKISDIIILSTEDTNETLDNPYIGINNHKIHKDKRNKREKQKYIENIKQQLNISESEFQLRVVFRKSLILDDTIPIETRWIEALKIGTDTHRIKFHEKLIYQYTLQQNTLSSLSISQIWSNIKNIPLFRSGKIKRTFSEEYMVLIQSYYNAASTYYFSTSYESAYRVINDGLKFFKSKKNQLYNCNTSTKQEIKHARMWYLLLQTLKVDIIVCDNNINASAQEANFELTYAENEFFKFYNSFPSSAVLLFRRYFLDKDIGNNTKIKLGNWLNDRMLWEKFDDDYLYKDHISMYKFLVFFYNSPEDMEKLINIFKAIERPVLSTEDRLLNYEATKFALEFVKPCINSTMSFHTDKCITFQNYIRNNTEITSLKFIITKLRILCDLEKENLIEELSKELTIDHNIIEQNVLHLIVTAAIDIDITSDKNQKKLKNVEKAIEFLDAYVKYYDNNLSNTKEDEQKNINEKKTNVTSKRTISLLIRYDWEASYRPGEWILNMPSTNPSKNEYTNQRMAKKMIEKLIYLKNNLKCPYINRIEIFTIIFRYLWMLKHDYVAMYTSIKSAITEIVVTPEDRLRNLKAHELLTMYLIERNEFGIKAANVLDIDQVYNTFLLDPDLR